MKREDNIVKKLWNRITIEQWHKALRVIIICMAFMTISDAIFEIPAVKNFFGADLITSQSGWMVYAVLWVVMFLQVAIIPIPALPILTACNQIPNLVGTSFKLSGLFSMQTLFFVLFVTSATLVGAIAAYWLGRTFGKKAVIWVAGSEKDYKLWSKKLNGKMGKWLYTSTVLLPIFPDDLISLVIGSIKMNFSFYVIVNAICKIIGLYAMLIFMRIPGIDMMFSQSTGFPWALTIYAAILLVCILINSFVNYKINTNQPKSIKLEVVKEELIEKLTKKKSVNKDLLIDYKIDCKFKTYLTSYITLHKYYTVDSLGNKQKIRIIISCKVSNFKQVLFDKIYKMTDTYDLFLEDVKQCVC